MSAVSFVQLLCLAAIWGSSFLFMRIAAHSFGPAYLIEFRVLFAALALLAVSFYLKQRLAFAQHAKHFFIIGLVNTALPFLCFAYAAQTLNASTLSVLNSTAAIWGALIGFLWHQTPLTGKAMLGMALGVFGVGVLVGPAAIQIGAEATWPIAAGVMAACCYGIATNYAKNAPKISAFDNAHGSLWAAVIWLLPLLPFVPMQAQPTAVEMGSVLILGLLCTGIAFLLYFRLIADVGPAPALSVTFLIPVFGILWGYLILDEPIGWNTLLGTAFVLCGTMLVTGFNVRSLWHRQPALNG